MTVRGKCFKAKAECTLHCDGRDGGAQCINTGPSTAPPGTFNPERNRRSAPPELNHNLKTVEPIHKEMLAWILIPHLRRILPMRAVICLTWILRRKWSLGRKRKRKRRRRRAMRRRAMRREMRKMSRFQMRKWSSVIVVASKRHPIVGITMMYRLFIIFH
jgi:hypothetical protein